MAPDLSLFSLEGLTAVVAGASRGIGFGIANGLAKAGASVVGFGRSAVGDGASFDYRNCDLTDAQAVTGLIRDVEAQSGGIDVYVHVAAVTLPADTGMQSVETFSKTIELNLTSAYRTCSLIGQSMAGRGKGSIITVASINAMQAFPGNPGYVSAKGGLRMMTKALALDLGPSNVRVNCILPGYVQTEMTAGSFNDPVKNKERANRTMLGRWGRVEDMVGVAIFLASDASAYATGADFVIDGGWTAKGL
jgi:NAD(P)-dependent dehydrogenase (short-subunit alcohol dehydrogenase family)